MNRQRMRGLYWRMTLVLGSLVAGMIGTATPVQSQQTVAAHVEHDNARATAELLARPITVVLTNVALRPAVDSVTRLAKVTVQYLASTLDAYPNRVTLRATALPLGVVLERILSGTSLRVVPNAQGDLTVVSTSSTPVDSVPQVGTVSGRVVDSASGRGLPGVTLKIVGTKLSAITTDSGRFVLHSVPLGDWILTIKDFGYRAAERNITITDGTPTTVRIALVSVPNVLSGVVTTATGLQRRIEVGNDITVLNADSIQQIAPVSNLTQMLETRVPGLIVQNTSGIPGAPSRLRLRGISSINSSSDPIVIVDGIRVYADQSGTSAVTINNQDGPTLGTNTGGGSSIGGSAVVVGSGSGVSRTYAGPSALDQIDPNSIETIEVLKGPSATAIYGSDAATGVIVITTKHGRVGPTRWVLNADAGRTTLPGQWPINWIAFTHEASPPYSGPCSLASFEIGHCQDSLVAFQALNDPRYSPLTGQAGQNRDVSLTVSGGSGGLTYSVTGSASSQTGYLHLPPIEQRRFQLFHGFPAPSWMVNPDQYTTWGGSSQMTAQLGKESASVTLVSSLFGSAQQQSSLQSDLSQLSQRYVDTTQLAAQPLFPDYYTRAQLRTVTFNNAVSLTNWAPWYWLPLNATAGLNVGTADNTSLMPRNYVTCTGNVSDITCGIDSLGSYAIAQGTNTVTSLTVGTLLARGRLISTALGLNVYSTAQSSFSGHTIDLPAGLSIPNILSYNDGDGPSINSTHVATYGWYIVPTLNLNSKFFASPGFRLDGGSASGTSSRAQLSLFPKLDLSYVAVNRPSDPLFGVLTLLRPRIAFGIAGIQPALGEQVRLLTEDPRQTITGTPIDGRALSTLGNPFLHPERDRELEGGMDIALWDQRLSLTITGYDKTAYDAILDIPVAPSVGAIASGISLTQAKNVGTIRNSGFEATANARLLDGRALSWVIDGKVSKNRNVVVSLVAGQPPLVLSDGSGYQTRLTPGYPIDGYWAAPITSYADANHDGFIEGNEFRRGDSVSYVGAPLPNYELTMGTTLAFFKGRLSVTTSIDYQNGLTQLNQGTGITNSYFSPTETLAQQAAVVASSQGISIYQGGTAIGLLQTVNVLRWNTLSINAVVPSRLSRLVRVPLMSLALQGSNLGIHTNYQGADPGVNAFSSGNLTADTGQLPQPRVWNLRVSIGN